MKFVVLGALQPLAWLLVTISIPWRATTALSPPFRTAPLTAKLVSHKELRAVSIDAADSASSTNGEFSASSPNGSISSKSNYKKPSDVAKHGGPLPQDLLNFPRHSHEGVNDILTETEQLIRQMHTHSKNVDARQVASGRRKSSSLGDMIFANTYVDLGKVDTVG
jgi:hypothetical protein